MPVNPNSHVPIYEQIVEHIRACVAAGVYRPGEALPSVRVLALELRVNPNTVQRAYQELERQRLARSRKGVAFFVAKEGIEEALGRTDAAMKVVFERGIQIGREAQLADDQIRAAFEKAWEGSETPSESEA